MGNPELTPAVLIFAGGKSSRMGTDKAKEQIHGVTLLQRAADFWRGVFPNAPIYIAAGKPEHFETLPEGTTPVYDIMKEQGPLGGLHAAFHQTEEDLFIISAVDMPLLTKEAVEYLTEKRTPGENVTVYTKDGSHPEPLFGYYSRALLPKIDEMLAEGNNRMGFLIFSGNHTLVPLPDLDWVENVNTQAELNAVRNRI